MADEVSAAIDKDTPARDRMSRAGVAAHAAAVPLVAIGILLLPMSEAGAARGAYASRWLALLIVCGFIGTSVVARVRRPGTVIPRLMAALGLAWFLAWLVASTAPLAHTVGLLTATFWVGLLIHMTVAFPSGRLRTAGERRVVAAGYAVGTVLHVPALLFSEHASVTCPHCPDNLVFVTAEQRLADVLLHLQLGGAIGVLVAGGAVLVRRWISATGPERRALAPVLWFGGATGLVAVVAITTAFAGLRELSAAFDWGYLTLFASIPFAFLAGLLRSELRRADAVSALVERLSEASTPSSLRDALAEALGDPCLQIAYWLPGEQCYVDDSGQTIALPLASFGHVTEIERDGRRIAAIVHDRSLAEESDLVRAAGAVAALGLERERLNAELRSHVDELRASRARIVQAGDSERRRLERDLHDGAQQRLVSAIFRLGMARHANEASAELLDALQAELHGALDDLRRLASGILPPILGDHGLEAAVEDLADRSPVEVLIGRMPSRRLPESVEIAAYFVITEALANAAKHAKASLVRVQAVDGGHDVAVEISDDGVGCARPKAGSGLEGLADRVGALGGQLTIDSPAAHGTTIRAHIPYRPRRIDSAGHAPTQQRDDHIDAWSLPRAGESQ